MIEFITQYWWTPFAGGALILVAAYLCWLWDRTGGAGSNSNRRGP